MNAGCGRECDCEIASVSYLSLVEKGILAATTRLRVSLNPSSSCFADASGFATFVGHSCCCFVVS